MQALCDYYIELRIYPGDCLQTVSQMYSLILRLNKQLFIETIKSRLFLLLSVLAIFAYASIYVCAFVHACVREVKWVQRLFIEYLALITIIYNVHNWISFSVNVRM